MRPERPLSRRLRRILTRATVFLAVGAAVLGCLELGLRFESFVREELALRRSPFLGDYWAVPDVDLGYRLNPAFGDHNELGLRDDPIEPKGERPRVLVLGDSIGYYGDSIRDTWVGRLEAQLQEDLGLAVDVVNACVKGYTTYQELLYLERDGLALEPDIVLLGFALNDLHRFLHGFQVRDGRIVQSQAYAITADSGRPKSRSLLVQWVRWRLERRALAAEPDSESFAFERHVGLRTAWQDAAWERERERLARLARLGREHDFRVAVVVFPVRDQYRPEDLARDRSFVLKPQRELRALCDRLDLPLLDLYDELDPERHLLPDGLHLTAEGRARVARRVATFLEQGEFFAD